MKTTAGVTVAGRGRDSRSVVCVACSHLLCVFRDVSDASAAKAEAMDAKAGQPGPEVEDTFSDSSHTSTQPPENLMGDEGAGLVALKQILLVWHAGCQSVWRHCHSSNLSQEHDKPPTGAEERMDA